MASAKKAKFAAVTMAGLGILSATLSGCGGSGPDLEVLYKDAVKNAKAAKSATIKGWVMDKGKKANIELSGETDGDPIRWRVSSAAGGSMDVIQIGKVSYANGDKKSLKSSEAAEILGGKYFKTTDNLESFTFKDLFDQFVVGDGRMLSRST